MNEIKDTLLLQHNSKCQEKMSKNKLKTHTHTKCYKAIDQFSSMKYEQKLTHNITTLI